MMAPPTSPEGPGLKVINASLFRMATKSMALAYVQLGYKVHHGLLEDVMDSPWAQLEKAAEATWPHAPSARPRPPFKRKDWDALWGSYDVVTDLASPFAPELIKAYPDAKVVVVQRDFDSWWVSMKSQVVDPVTIQPGAWVFGVLGMLLGKRAVQAMRKIHFGFFHANNKEEIAANARETYDNYFEEIRSLVPPERRLEYKIGSGWKPLCEFLDVPIPDVPFPRANDTAEHQVEGTSRKNKVMIFAAMAVAPWVVAAIGAWVYYQRR